MWKNEVEIGAFHIFCLELRERGQNIYNNLRIILVKF